MKQCPMCGKFSDDGVSFCSSCGAPMDGDSTVRQYPPVPSFSDFSQPGGQRAASKQEYLDLPENKKMKNNITGAAIVSYICAGITAVVMIGTMRNYVSVFDALLLIGLGLGIHFKQSRVCAILLCADGLLSMIASIVSTGTPSGYLILIAGIYATIYTFKLEKEWQQYQAQ